MATLSHMSKKMSFVMNPWSTCKTTTQQPTEKANMKSLSLLTAALLGLTLAANAALAAAPAKPAAKEEAVAKANKPMPMNHKVDVIDKAAKSISWRLFMISR